MAKIKFHIDINPISGKSYYSVSFSKEDISVDGVRKALQRLQLLCDNPDIQIN